MDFARIDVSVKSISLSRLSAYVCLRCEVAALFPGHGLWVES